MVLDPCKTFIKNSVLLFLNQEYKSSRLILCLEQNLLDFKNVSSRISDILRVSPCWVHFSGYLESRIQKLLTYFISRATSS